jgi:glutathione S-transferase
MKLYQSSSSPNSRRVRIFLAEKKVKVDLVPVNLAEKEQFSEAYRTINPRSMVPALLLDDGNAIAEVPAIQRYVEEVSSAHPLLGTTPLEKAQIAMWESRAELDGFASVMEAVRNTFAGLKGRALAGPHAYEQIPALAERSKQRVQNFYQDFDDRLASVPYVAGERFSVADITALVTIDFATSALGLPIPEQLTSLRSWYDKVAARDSAKA